MSGNNWIATVGVLIIRDGKVLLVRHGDSAKHLTGTYGLPAGKVSEDESLEEAAIRELSEETGLVAKKENLKIIPKEYFAEIRQKTGVKSFNFRVFICDSFSGELKPTDETQPEWVPIGELDNYDLLANTKDIVGEGMEPFGQH